MHGAILLVGGPCGACDVAADYTLDGEDSEALDDHAAFLELVAVVLSVLLVGLISVHLIFE